jgi:predicted metal-dependent hydrolase
VAKPDDTKVLRVAEREIPLLVTRNPRARRISISLDGSGAVRLVLPRRTSLRHGLDFAEDKAGWIIDHLDALPARVPFEAGAILPLLGVDHVICHDPAARRGVWRTDGTIQVSGQRDHLPRRVRDFLKIEARREISQRAHEKAKIIGRAVRRLTLRDTTSRWGSCSAEGNLNFTWRLILAPEAVLDYVVAHEIAHLKHMNHGARFWALVGRLTDDATRSRRWLRERGDHLQRYG